MEIGPPPEVSDAQLEAARQLARATLAEDLRHPDGAGLGGQTSRDRAFMLAEIAIEGDSSKTS
jgi:hypothetical protein